MLLFGGAFWVRAGKNLKVSGLKSQDFARPRQVNLQAETR